MSGSEGQPVEFMQLHIGDSARDSGNSRFQSREELLELAGASNVVGMDVGVDGILNS